MEVTKAKKINGFDVQGLSEIIEGVKRDPKTALVKFQVASSWTEGTKSTTCVESWELAGQELSRGFTINIDEPEELLGTNTAPNPQEMLMAAFNACMLVGYVAGCSLKGIRIEKLEIRTEGQLDLRGCLGLDASVKPGYDEIRYTVTIKGNGAPEDFREIHETVMATSPNRWNVANPIKLDANLILEIIEGEANLDS